MTDSLISGNSLPAQVTAPRDPLTLAGPPVARTLLDVFAATVARCAGRTAIDAPGSTLTYLELDDAARSLANRLRSCGVGPGDRVGVRVPSGTADLYIAILGVLSAGAAYVPVDADDPDARADAIFDDSGVCAVVGKQLQIAHLREARGVDRQPLPDDDAWVIFTSGSTGRPKGVAVTHRAAAAFVDAEAGLWTVDPEDRVLAGLSVGFDASCEEIWLAWRNGATLVPAPRERVRAGLELGPWLAERRVTVVSTVPTLAAMWDEADLAAVRLLILGGEACPEPLAWRLAAGRELWNTYGPTEATVVSTATRLVPGSPVTIGWPLRGWEVAILDEVGEPVAVGEPGELVIAGVGLGRYLDSALDAERYAAVPALGWRRAYRTGDIVCETIDGLRFIGRHDDQVKLGGRRIELGEVEAALARLPGVRAAAATLQKTEAGNPVLVGYIVGDVDPAAVSRGVSETLPRGVVPLVLTVDSLPLSSAGKVDRTALPWPPAADARELTGTAAWLAERWAEQLGPLPIGSDSDFFELGGSSLGAAKLTSALRSRYPAVAVSDVYNFRRLGQLADRLEELGSVDAAEQPRLAGGWRRWGALQLLTALLTLVLEVPGWALVILALDRITGIGPQLSWLWLIAGWIVFESLPARMLFVMVLRRVLLGGLSPGRYPRHGWLMWRLSLLHRVEGLGWLGGLAGTPWAARYARLCGHTIGAGARLLTLPSITSLVAVGEGATIEADVDIDGWWIEGNDLVVGEVRIGPGARVGTHALLLPGASIGAGADIEPGSVINGSVPAGEHWEGSPASYVGPAGENWPASPGCGYEPSGTYKLLYAGGLALRNLLPLLSAAPAVLVALAMGAGDASGIRGTARDILVLAPLLAVTFLIAEMAVLAIAVRLAGRLIKPGWHRDYGPTAWALWLTESLMETAHSALFPLYASLYTRGWLRLLGVRVGRRTEISTAVGLNRLTSFGEASFAADLATCAAARQRGGWLHVTPIEIGDRSFIGNGAMLKAGTQVGNASLIGVLTTSPETAPDGTSWLGAPALELPRCPPPGDPARTVEPPMRLIVARGAVELVRILLPATFSIALGTVVFGGLDEITKRLGVAVAAAAVMPVLLVAGIAAVLFTIGLKWLLMQRYRPGEHPLWSLFVWRDEIINTCQEQIAGPWLMNLALGTPAVSLYLRLMGARVGRDVWCDTLTIVEFDAVELGDGCALNRASVVQTHLYHDRVLRIGLARLGAGSTLGPDSHVLPDTVLGPGSTVGWRSIVMWGEELPGGTRWQGAPVRSA